MAFYRLSLTDGVQFKYIYLKTMQKQNLEIFVVDIDINLMKIDKTSTNNYLNILNSNVLISFINKPIRVG